MASDRNTVVVQTFGPGDSAGYQAGKPVVNEINERAGLAAAEEARLARLTHAGMTALGDVSKLTEAAVLFGDEFSPSEQEWWRRYLHQRSRMSNYEGSKPPEEALREIEIARALGCFKFEVWYNDREAMVVGCYPKKKKSKTKEWQNRSKHYFGIVRWGTPRRNKQALPTLDQLRRVGDRDVLIITLVFLLLLAVALVCGIHLR